MKQRTAFLITTGLTAFLLVGVGMLASRIDLSNNGAASPTETVESAAEALPAQPDLSPAAEQMPVAPGLSQPATTPQLPTTAGLASLPSSATEPAGQAMETQPPAATDAPPPTPTADVIAVLTEREAQYRALLEEANRRLEEANQQLAKLEQQLEAVQATQSAPAPVANASQSQATQRPRVQPAQPQPVIQAALTPQRALEIALITAPGTVAQRMPELVDFQGVVAYEVLLNAGTMYIDANSGAILYNGVVVQPPPPPQSPPVYYDDDDDDDHDDDDHEKHEKHEKKEKKKKKHKD